MIFGRKKKWKKIAASEQEISGLDKGIGTAEVDGKKICVASYGGRLHAFSYLCPHAGGPLFEGEINAKGDIICPVHGYHFNIRNGYNSSGEGFKLNCWPMEIREDGVYIETRV